MLKNNILTMASGLLLLVAASVAAEPVGDIEVEGTLDIRGPVLGLGIFNTIAGDSGSITASGPITTIEIIGGPGVLTSVVDGKLTITVGAWGSGGVPRLGHAGGQEVYGGTGDNEDLILGSTINSGKGSIILGTAANPLIKVNEATAKTVLTGTVEIQ